MVELNDSKVRKQRRKEKVLKMKSRKCACVLHMYMEIHQITKLMKTGCHVQRVVTGSMKAVL